MRIPSTHTCIYMYVYIYGLCTCNCMHSFPFSPLPPPPTLPPLSHSMHLNIRVPLPLLNKAARHTHPTRTNPTPRNQSPRSAITHDLAPTLLHLTTPREDAAQMAPMAVTKTARSDQESRPSSHLTRLRCTHRSMSCPLPPSIPCRTPGQ